MDVRQAIVLSLHEKLIKVNGIKEVYYERETWDKSKHRTPSLFIVTGPESVEQQTNKEDLSTWVISIYGIDKKGLKPETQLNDHINNVRSKIYITDPYLESSTWISSINGGCGLQNITVTEILSGVGESHLEEVSFGIDSQYTTFKLTVEVQFTITRT